MTSKSSLQSVPKYVKSVGGQANIEHMIRKFERALSQRLERLKDGYCLGKIGSHTDDVRAVHVLNANVERDKALGSSQ